MSSPSVSRVDLGFWGRPYQAASLNLPLFQWLAFAALADWLITRTLTRMAIFMPKSAAVVVIYQAAGLAGQLATTLAGLLGLAALGWIVWREWQGGSAWLALVLVGLGVFSLAFLIVPPSGWLMVTNHALGLAAVTQTLRISPGPSRSRPVPDLRYGVWERPGRDAGRGAPSWHGVAGAGKNLRVSIALLPGMALLAGRLHQAMAALYTAMGWPGPPFLAGALFNLGELLVVLAAAGLWWVYGQGVSWRIWLGAGLPVLIFAAMRLAIPSMTGILAIWSTGLTLYLPWPLYVAGLWLAGVAILASLRRGDPAGWAILLLAASGYAPQQSHQVFMGMIALWLLAVRDIPIIIPTRGYHKENKR